MTAAPTLVAVGRAVRERRRALGLTQETLAERSGLHRTYISGIECGLRNLSLLNLVALSAALGVRLSDLVADAERNGERPR